MHPPMAITQLQAPDDDQPAEDSEDCINYQRIMPMEEGFEIAPPKSKPSNKRKAELVEVHGGGRVVRSAGRKDRHSKVSTARGPRNRRLRLSPETAIQFYDVQDRLGYDRPSKAIDWLIKEAKATIDALDEGVHVSPPSAAADDRSPSGANQLSRPFPDFSFFVGGNNAPSSSTELKAHFDDHVFNARNSSDDMLNRDYEHGFCSASCDDLQMLETDNWEMGGLLQNRVSWNDINETERYSLINSQPLHFPAEPVLGHGQMLSQREPLQSSVIDDSAISDYFPGFVFSDITAAAAAATMEDGERGKQPVFRIPFSPDSFRHCDEG